MSLMGCFSSRDLADIWDPMELLTTSQNMVVVSFPYLPFLFHIDPKQQELRTLTEMYVHFNAYNAGNPIGARLNLDDLIDKYLHSSNPIFINFANLLIRNHEYIINSFVRVERHGEGAFTIIVYPIIQSNH